MSISEPGERHGLAQGLKRWRAYVLHVPPMSNAPCCVRAGASWGLHQRTWGEAGGGVYEPTVPVPQLALVGLVIDCNYEIQ